MPTAAAHDPMAGLAAKAILRLVKWS